MAGVAEHDAAMESLVAQGFNMLSNDVKYDIIFADGARCTVLPDKNAPGRLCARVPSDQEVQSASRRMPLLHGDELFRRVGQMSLAADGKIQMPPLTQVSKDIRVIGGSIIDKQRMTQCRLFCSAATGCHATLRIFHTVDFPDPT